MEWLLAGIGLALVGLIIAATVLTIRHREQMRAIAREAEKINVLSNDTRHAYWYSAADRSDDADSSSSSGSGGSND